MCILKYVISLMVDDEFKSILQDQQKMIKDFELKKNYEELVIKIDEMIVYLNRYRKKVEDSSIQKTIDILIKSYENKKANIQYFTYINKYKLKINKKIFDIYKDQFKNRNEAINKDNCPPQLSPSNNPNLYTLFEFEIVDNSNIQDMMKAILSLCETTLVDISAEKNLILNYNVYVDELKKIKIFMNNLLNEGLLINSNIDNYQTKSKEISEKVQKYKKKSLEIVNYLIKKGVITEQQINKKSK